MTRDGSQGIEAFGAEPFCTSLDYLLDDEQHQSEVTNDYYQGSPNILHKISAIIMAIAKTIIWLSGILLWLGGIGIHLWTAIIALRTGDFGAFVTFLLPVGEILWAWKSYVYSGYFWNSYIIILIAYVVTWGLVILSTFIVSIWSDSQT